METHRLGAKLSGMRPCIDVSENSPTLFTAQDAVIHTFFKLGITWLRPPAPNVEPLEKEACADRFRVAGS